MNAAQTCSKQRFHIIDDYFIDISVNKNVLNIPLDSLFSLAMRKNKKRGFLFVSKLIGKHIPIHPDIVSVTGGLLAEFLIRGTNQGAHYDVGLLAKALDNPGLLKNAMTEITSKKFEIDKPTLFIGFAETATGIAQAAFSAFSGDCRYIHTTREVLLDKEPAFVFEEEHSHATSHLCYFDNAEYLKQAKRIVLIDDEMTTGKTSLNFIKSLLEKCDAKEVVILSILDWRNETECNMYTEFEKDYSVRIKCLSLMKGNITVAPQMELNVNNIFLPDTNNIPVVNNICLDIGEKQVHQVAAGTASVSRNYSDMTGRFGISAEINNKNHELFFAASQKLKSLRKYKKTLCIGTGELIYIPSKLAGGMGEGCLFFSSTLSPIIHFNNENYPIKNAISYVDINAAGKTNSTYNIYNILPGLYPEVFMISEQEFTKDIKAQITFQLGNYGVKSLNFVSLV
jgi:orotate phosphoribosyltransferase